MTLNSACIIKVTLMFFLYQSEFKSSPLTFSQGRDFSSRQWANLPGSISGCRWALKVQNFTQTSAFTQLGSNSAANRAHTKSPEVSRNWNCRENSEKIMKKIMKKEWRKKNNYQAVQNHIFISGRSSMKEKIPMLSSLLHLSFLPG